MSGKRAFTKWTEERKRMFQDSVRISNIEIDAHCLVEELRRRRDGEPPRKYDLRSLRAAVALVDSSAESDSELSALAARRRVALVETEDST